MPIEIKVFFTVLVFASFSFYHGIRWVAGWEKIEWLGVRKRWLEMVFGFIFVSFSFLVLSSITLDIVHNDVQTETVEVTGKRSKHPTSIIKSSIVTEQGVFDNYFHTFNFTTDSTYEITYLKRTGIIVDAIKR